MFELFFKIQILLRFYSTFSHFVSNFLDHPNIILKTKLSGIHNFEYNTKKLHTLINPKKLPNQTTWK
jgi:hypothetical protein